MWTYNHLQSNEICHYGVLGMKWGRRTATHLKITPSDSSVTKKVKNDFNKMSDNDFRQKYKTTKSTYSKRVEKYGDPYMNSPLAKFGKFMEKQAKNNASRYMQIAEEKTAKKNKDIKDVSHPISERFKELGRQTKNSTLHPILTSKAANESIREEKIGTQARRMYAYQTTKELKDVNDRVDAKVAEKKDSKWAKKNENNIFLEQIKDENIRDIYKNIDWEKAGSSKEYGAKVNRKIAEQLNKRVNELKPPKKSTLEWVTDNDGSIGDLYLRVKK